jgi:long-chain acyl-CoA synthetase
MALCILAREELLSDRPFAWERSYPENLDWGASIETGTVPALLDMAAAECPEWPALHFRDRTISYAQWNHEADRFAVALLNRGLAPGHTIAILMPNTLYLPIVFFGILKAGGRAVLLSTLDPQRVLAHKIGDSGARTLVTTNVDGMLASATALLQAGELQRVIVADDALLGDADLARESIPDNCDVIALDQFLQSAGNHGAWPEIGTDDIAALQYTGGTTGLPKAAILTHGNLTAAISSYDTWFQSLYGDGDGAERVLCVLPLFHVYGLSAVMLLCLKRRAELVLHMRFDAGRVLADIEAKGITAFPGVPTMWIALANHPDLTRRDLSKLLRCSSGGAPLPNEIGRRLEELLGLRLAGGWGMTETASAGTALLPHGEPKPGSIGMPLPGVELQVVALEDGERPLGVGEIGELRVRGRNITVGYWNRPEETSAAIRGGYLLTGDIGYMARDGYFYIVDRKKDMIISGGFNVYPQMIEQAIYEHPAVAECIVLGVPDPYRGESAKAFVVLREGAQRFTLEELSEFLADLLGRHEIPRALEFRPHLPKTPVGKLSRKELREEERQKAVGSNVHGTA